MSPLRPSQFLLLVCLLVPTLAGMFSCRRLIQPWKSGFKYYDKDYTPDIARSKLRADGMYIDNWKKPGDERGHDCKYLRFSPSGEVRVVASYCDLRYTEIRNMDKEIFGYYKLQGDTIYWTTKAYYRKKENTYFGIVYYDSIKVWVKTFDRKVFRDTYYFRTW